MRPLRVSNTDKQQEISKTYEKVKKLIYHTVHTFREMNKQGDSYPPDMTFEDLLSEAHEHFLDAYHKYDPSRGTKLSTWIQYKVFKGLCSTRRLNRQRNFALRRQSSKALQYVKVYDPAWKKLLCDLSEDGSRVVNLTLYPPIDLQGELGKGRERTLLKHKKALKEFLLEMGWCAKRIKESFSEVRKALL